MTEGQCRHSEGAVIGKSVDESSDLNVSLTEPDIEKKSQLERDKFTNNFFKNDFNLHIAMIAGFPDLSKK